MRTDDLEFGMLTKRVVQKRQDESFNFDDYNENYNLDLSPDEIFELEYYNDDLNLSERQVKKVSDFVAIQQQKINNSKEKDNANVKIFVTKDKYKIKPTNENGFVLLFAESLQQIIKEYKLTAKEIEILLYVVDKMKIGNLIALKQSAIAKAMNEKAPNISRAFKKFKSSGLIIEDETGTYFNCQIFTKSNLHQTKTKHNNVYELSNKATKIRNY